MSSPTRTPEGEPARCDVCGKASFVEPSRPPGDAPCPFCGTLLWLPETVYSRTRIEETLKRRAPERAPRQVASRPRKQAAIRRVAMRRAPVRRRNRLTALGLRCGLTCVCAFWALLLSFPFVGDPSNWSSLVMSIMTGWIISIFVGLIASLLAIAIGAFEGFGSHVPHAR